MNTSVFSLNATGEKAETPRPLNSWMAFRSFYSDLFVGFPQKSRSTLLKEMWRHDPFKTKWAIIAKAYSVVRDKLGKSNVPLSKFCAMATPKLGIIPAQTYLEELRWTIMYSGDGVQLTRFEGRNIMTFPENIRFTILTSEDLVSQFHKENPQYNNLVDITNTNRPNQILSFSHATVQDETAVSTTTLGITNNIGGDFLDSLCYDAIDGLTSPDILSYGLSDDFNQFLQSIQGFGNNVEGLLPDMSCLTDFGTTENDLSANISALDEEKNPSPVTPTSSFYPSALGIYCNINQYPETSPEFAQVDPDFSYTMLQDILDASLVQSH